MFLVKSEQDFFDLLADLCGLCLGLEAIAEVPSLVVKSRVVPWKEFNLAVPQNEKVVITYTGQPALRLRRGLASSSRHGSPTPGSFPLLGCTIIRDGQ